MNSEPKKVPESQQPEPLVNKAEGTTAAEKYLASLCEKSFLSLWSYPGVFRDQGKKGSDGDGKEICDLLVVFDNNIIVFSDKDCHFPNSGNPELDWKRWFRRAIQKSADQVWGAERWIRQYPARIFLDRSCKRALPIDLPPIEVAKFHLIVVAHGVSSRIRQSFRGSGSLFIDTGLTQFEHHVTPFYVGDLSRERTFVHVLDDDSLQLLMKERDTISDFVDYLNKRERLFRGQQIVRATGEEQLLAIYLRKVNEKNEHDFIFEIPTGQKFDFVHVPEGHWESFQKEPQRLAQQNDNQISYAWDNLIEKFNYYALRGEQHFVTGGGIRDTEKVLRFMAREPRWKRRYFAGSLLEALRDTPAHMRRLRTLPPTDENSPFYVFLIFPHPVSVPYEKYRDVRKDFLYACCTVVKLENLDAEDIVGIATEAGLKNGGRSEDAIYFDARNWTKEMEEQAKLVQDEFGILKSPKYSMQRMHEYPEIPIAGHIFKNPRNKPCPCGSGVKYKHCCLNKK